MEELYTVALSDIINELSLESIYLPTSAEKINISCTRVNRPGLQMVGFYDHYEQQRLQIIGKVENLYLETLPKKERMMRLEDFFQLDKSGYKLFGAVRTNMRRANYASRAVFECILSHKSAFID